MFYLLPSPLSQKKKKNMKPASKYPAFHLHECPIRASPLIPTAIFFFFFLDFVALTPSHDYFAYQKFRIPHQEIENPLLFFNVALNASNPQILYTVNSFFNCSSNLTYTLPTSIYVYICAYIYIYGNRRKFRRKRKKNLVFPGSIKKKKGRRKKERIERYYNFKCNFLGVRPRRPFDLSNSRNDAATP